MNTDRIKLEYEGNKIKWQQDLRYWKYVAFDYLTNEIIVEEDIVNFDQANDIINKIKETLK